MRRILDAALSACNADRLLSRALADPVLHERLTSTHVVLLAAGKAAAPMSTAFLRAHEGRLLRGLVVAPDNGPLLDHPRITWMQGGHPLPTESSLAAGRQALELALSVDPDHLFVVLLSGGASAMMAVPIDGVTLAEKTATTAALLRGGADIHAVNTVRKHLSQIKGGRLAAACRGATLALVLSDVVGDDLGVIASGPTVGDRSSFGEAIAALTRYGVTRSIAPGALDALERGAAGLLPETPKPGSIELARTETRLIGSLADAVSGAREEARARGYDVTVLDGYVTGEARIAACDYVERVAALLQSRHRRRSCVVSGGETTVAVHGNGRGGRNQEFMLAAVPGLARLGLPFAAASIGTDGIDGPTDAAGAMIDSDTPRRLAEAQVDPDRVLAANDSYPAFDKMGDLIRTGPTGTNVGDLQVALIE